MIDTNSLVYRGCHSSESMYMILFACDLFNFDFKTAIYRSLLYIVKCSVVIRCVDTIINFIV